MLSLGPYFRNLLTHKSGLAYVYIKPLLTRYAQLPIAEPRNSNNTIVGHDLQMLDNLY